MKIYRGSIITCDKDDNVASYLVENNGEILFVGDELDDKYLGNEIIDITGKAIIPTFVDSHIHFASFATFYSGLNVMEAISNQELLTMLKKFVENAKDKTIIAFGASPHSVEEKRLVTREELDSVCKDRPIFLVKYDGHACVLNSALLNKVKDKIKNLRGYHEDTGEMNQEAFFAVSDYITNSISIINLIKNMQNAIDYLASKGIAHIHSVSGVGFTRDLDVDLERWFAKGLDNGIDLRVYFQTMNVKDAVKRKLDCIGGCFKCALDGCFGSKDAALRKPYNLSDDRGILYYSDEEVIRFCIDANRANLQIQMHAIGDAAFDQATKALKAALDDYPRENHRHCIIHACLPTEEGIKICKDYNILLPVQSAFIDWKQEPNEYLEEILGQRYQKLNPLRTFIDNKIIISAGSDGPCTDPNPIEWIYKACNNGKQSLTILEAIKMCTYNGYYTSFKEEKYGSLEAGKKADFLILNKNPLDLDNELLNTLKIEKMLLGGKDYKKVDQNPIIQVIKGIVK